MASLNMKGPYALNTETIDKEVTKTSPGNYALGSKNDKGGLTVSYVGRDDKNVNSRLKSWVGKKKSYTHFKFSYATSPKAAFEEECRNYHDWGENEKLDNDIHPARPDGTKWQCPYCDAFKESQQ